jgi:hypothetical protein
MRRRHGPMPTDDVLGAQVVQPRQVAFCHDMLGNRYRFIQTQVQPEVWRPGETPVPWVVWYDEGVRALIVES